MWLILIDAMSIACPVALALLALSGENRLRLGKVQASLTLLSTCTVLTLAVPFALCADVVAEHSAEDEVLFGCEFVQWTGDDESDSLQTFASPEINILILSSCRLKQVWDALTL